MHVGSNKMDGKFYHPMFLFVITAVSQIEAHGGCSCHGQGTGCCYSAVDCQDVQNLGFKNSGVYHVTPVGTYTGFEVYCDLTADECGGWTVIQRRTNGSVDFNKDWDEYEEGFPKDDRTGEFWLGLHPIYTIVSAGYYEMRIDMEDWDGSTHVANYRIFKIGSPDEKYKLTIAGYDNETSDAGDSMIERSDTRVFATSDKDTGTTCAATCKGGWWYSESGNCHNANLNGLWVDGGTATSCTGIVWETLKGQSYSMKKVEMKIRRI